MIEFTILGEPKGKARHRTTKSGHTYTPKTTVDYENMVIRSYQMEYMGRQLLEGELKATITAYYGIAKSIKGKKRAEREKNIIRPTKKPDADNVAKIVLDSLNNVVYKDDAAIVELVVSKYWSNEPRVEVIIEQIGG